MFQLNQAVGAAVVGLSVVGMSAISAPAYALGFTNGGFANNSLGGASSGYLGSGGVTIDGWTIGNQAYGFLLSDGDAATTDMNADGPDVDPNNSFLEGPGGIPVRLYSQGQTVNSADGSGWFIAMDGAFPSAASIPSVSQTLTGLTQGLQYTVSFWQAAGQQDGFDGDSQSGWTVSFGGASQTSPTMLHPSKAPVSGWQQVTMNFTATSSTEVLSFLATGSPAGQPPFSLLSGVSVSEVPTPALLPGLVGLGVAALRKRKGEGSEEAEE